MSRRISRRQALAAGAASLGYLYTAPAASAAKIDGANDKLTVIGIGVAGKGSSDIDHAGSLMEVIGLCDVDDGRLAPKAKKWPNAKTFSDLRKIFDDKELMKAASAVTVSTADHTHALAAGLAIMNGKHVYCQKPLTRTSFEAHLLRKLAKEHKVCTQMGNQGTANPGLRRAVELIQSGLLGDIKEVHVWTNRPWTYWKQAPDIVERPAGKEPPKNLNWDAWIGPAPEREYNPQYHPMQWRGFWDFGTGAIGDMACHTANMAFMALKLGHPNRVSAEAGGVNPETCPAHAHVTLNFPARGSLPAVTLNWYEGKKDGKKQLPPEELLSKVLKPGEKPVDSGSILVGEKGILYSPNDYGAQFRLTPGDLGSGMNLTKPEKLAAYTGDDDLNQKKEWVEAIKAGKPEIALSNFDYASFLASAFVLGNVAIRTGKSFEFDGETLTAKGNPDAAALIKPTYRKGWNLLPGIEATK